LRAVTATIGATVPCAAVVLTKRTRLALNELEVTIDWYIANCARDGTVARVSELASLLGVTREHLSRTARNRSGRPLVKLLRERQLNHVKQLLLTVGSVDDAISQSTLGDRSTFFRVFGSLAGLTPTAFRRDKITNCD
jgi:AraC-like DNA-binding protein